METGTLKIDNDQIKFRFKNLKFLFYQIPSKTTENFLGLTLSDQKNHFCSS